MAKIVLPKNPTKILELAQRILDKHDAFNGATYLTPLITEKGRQKIANGLEMDKEAKRLEKEVKKIYKNRDMEAKEAIQFIRRSRDVLKGMFGDNLWELGDFGFTVND